MSLINDAKKISNIYLNMRDNLATNCVLLDIFEGNLLPYVLADMRQQLSPKAFTSASTRVPPINLLKRLIDKLSTIYSQTPQREVTGSEEDGEMWEWYMKSFSLDVQMQLANEYFNMHKATALEPYLDSEFNPRLRILPNDRFFVISSDIADPLKPTHFVKVMGKKMVDKYVQAGEQKQVAQTVEKMILYVYSATEFLVIDEDGDIQTDIMAQLGVDGSNPYKALPFIYLNRSKTKICPSADTDLLSMTKLVPIMMTDVNYAIMFQAFSIIYTIDVDSEKMELNPNVIMNLKSDSTTGNKPSIGSIKPELDSDKALAAVKEQIALWLQSRNIRPGATGQVSSENFNSGISKMVDEMDTTQERKKTIPFFQQAEMDLFNLVTKKMHPIFSRMPSFEKKAPFTQDCALGIQFSDQIVVPSKGELLAEVKEEMSLGLISKRSAMEKVNPNMSPEEIDKELAEIDTERTVNMPEDADGNKAPEVQP